MNFDVSRKSGPLFSNGDPFIHRKVESTHSSVASFRVEIVVEGKIAAAVVRPTVTHPLPEGDHRGTPLVSLRALLVVRTALNDP